MYTNIKEKKLRLISYLGAIEKYIENKILGERAQQLEVQRESNYSLVFFTFVEMKFSALLFDFFSIKINFH